ncbi:hypothetical protein SERLADRAFT_365177 [Serpula lacrymans var. lacrymans S7.9]|nr:uncharacterized protein SERLADRAFT_365177 [Serpula lacrymans var. lacrymans S7.9]EGO29156.1 hypothetical protein SERLADRAFT_365177 [Serpula lacrymans var. lacrymans S7.9]
MAVRSGRKSAVDGAPILPEIKTSIFLEKSVKRRCSSKSSSSPPGLCGECVFALITHQG